MKLYREAHLQNCLLRMNPWCHHDESLEFSHINKLKRKIYGFLRPLLSVNRAL